MKNLEDKEEKRALLFFLIVAYIFLSAISYFVWNKDLGLHLSFFKFFLISFCILAFGGKIQGRWYNKAYRLFEDEINKYVIAGIFYLIILPLTVGSSIIVYLGLHYTGLAVFSGVCFFFGALTRQAALDTIINTFRYEKEKILQDKIRFEIIKDISK